MSETTTSSELFNPAAVEQAVEVIIAGGARDGDRSVFEVRALEARIGFKTWATTYSGYFDNAADLVKALEKLKAAKGIYLTPNPVNPALLARASNRLREVKKGESTSDADITSRRWLLIDADPVRPSGISSTDAEHDAALERCRLIAADLSEVGWPEPIVADSGNGGHLLYQIDLPAQDSGLVERCLKILASRFDDETVKVDTTVHNPARIWKLYGTLTCKGDSTPDRPHRMSKLISSPKQLSVVPEEKLIELANLETETPPVSPAGSSERTLTTHGHFAIDRFVAAHLPHATGPTPWQGGRRWILNPCPWNSSHTDGSAYLLEMPSGAISAGCHHSGCSQHNWHTLRAMFEPRTAKPLKSSAVRGTSTSQGASVYDVASQFKAAMAPAGLDDESTPDPDDLPPTPEVAPFLPFPLECLPTPLANLAREVGAATGTEPAWAAITALVACAGLIGTTLKVGVKDSWGECPVLWGVLIAPSGSTKSAVMNLVLAPIDHIHRSERKEFEEKFKQYEKDRLLYEVKLDTWKTAGKKGQEPGEAPDEPVPPVESRTIISDATMEKVMHLLQQNPRGLLLFRDEMAGWVGGFDRYASGGKGSDQAAWLTFFGAGSVTVDRKSGPSLYVPRGAVSVIGSIQPGVFARVFGQMEKDSGLLARLIPCYPPPRPLVWTDADVSRETTSAWTKVVEGLHALEGDIDPFGNPEPKPVTMTKAARQLFSTWYNEHGKDVANADGEDLRAHLAKMMGICARVAVIFAAVDAVTAKGGPLPVAKVELQHIEAAIIAMEWFKSEAGRVYAMMGITGGASKTRQLAEFVIRRGGSITVRQLQQARRKYRTAKSAEEALQAMVDAGEGKWAEKTPGENGGRPSRTFHICSSSLPRLPGPPVPQTPATPPPAPTQPPPAPTKPLLARQKRGFVGVGAVGTPKSEEANEPEPAAGNDPDWGEV